MKVKFSTLYSPILNVKEEKKESKSGFGEILQRFIEDVNSDLKNAKKAEEALIDGNVSNLEETMYKIEKADLSLRLLVEIRNKAIESYQEIMRMQV
ncbi:MAG: flagellar hook-basal body complex protein FliE [Desulfurobacteriaceae bacterium]